MTHARRRPGAAIALLSFLLALAPPLRAGAGGDPLKAAGGDRAVVLLFIARDCPISNTYAPEVQRIVRRYAARRVAFRLVYADPGLSRADAAKHAREYGYTCPILMDPAHRWARRVGATVTPEAAVLAPDGRLLYRGRIDDKYVSWGKARFRTGKHDLRDALDAVLAGRPVPAPRTTAIGCFI